MGCFVDTLAHQGSSHRIRKKRQIANEQTEAENMKLEIFFFPEHLGQQRGSVS